MLTLIKVTITLCSKSRTYCILFLAEWSISTVTTVKSLKNIKIVTVVREEKEYSFRCFKCDFVISKYMHFWFFVKIFFWFLQGQCYIVNHENNRQMSQQLMWLTDWIYAQTNPNEWFLDYASSLRSIGNIRYRNAVHFEQNQFVRYYLKCVAFSWTINGLLQNKISSYIWFYGMSAFILAEE